VVRFKKFRVFLNKKSSVGWLVGGRLLAQEGYLRIECTLFRAAVAVRAVAAVIFFAVRTTVAVVLVFYLFVCLFIFIFLFCRFRFWLLL
jgi:hypothetical protein